MGPLVVRRLQLGRKFACDFLRESSISGSLHRVAPIQAFCRNRGDVCSSRPGTTVYDDKWHLRRGVRAAVAVGGPRNLPENDDLPANSHPVGDPSLDRSATSITAPVNMSPAGSPAGPSRSLLHPEWEEHVKQLQRPIARNLADQLVRTNCLGFPLDDPRKSTPMLTWFLNSKSQQPTHIHLARVGDFYEAFGIDALMLIEYCGLTPMGGKLRAGFPNRNIQEMLDRLIAVGLSVAVYEELSMTCQKAHGSSKGRVRSLIQVVSPISPVYFYNSILATDEAAGVQECPRPAAGIHCRDASGFDLVLFDLQLKTATVYSCLSSEALQTELFLADPALPIYTLAVSGSNPVAVLEREIRSYVNRSARSVRSPSLRGSLLQVVPDIPSKPKQSLGPGTVDAQRVAPSVGSAKSPENSLLSRSLTVPIQVFADHILNHLCKMHMVDVNSIKVKTIAVDSGAGNTPAAVGEANDGQAGGFGQLEPVSFTVKAIPAPQPLWSSTCTHIGLEGCRNVPCLVESLTSPKAAPYIKRFLRNWLVCPPQYSVTNLTATAMNQLRALSASLLLSHSDLGSLKGAESPLKAPFVADINQALSARVLSLHRVVALLEARQCNVAVYNEIFNNLAMAAKTLTCPAEVVRKACDAVWELIPTQVSSFGYSMSQEDFLRSAASMFQIIRGTVLLTEGTSPDSVNTDSPSNQQVYDLLTRLSGDPNFAYFARNERKFRYRLVRNCCPEVAAAYSAVENSAQALLEVLLFDFASGLQLKDVLQKKPQAIQNFQNFCYSRPLRQNILNNTLFIQAAAVSRSGSFNFTRQPRSSDLTQESATKTEEELTAQALPSKSNVIKSTDRRGRILEGKFTTFGFNRAVAQYLFAVDNAEAAVRAKLRSLAAQIHPFIPSLAISSAFLTLIQSLFLVARTTSALGWTMPTLEPLSGRDPFFPLKLKGMFPYWIQTAATTTAPPNKEVPNSSTPVNSSMSISPQAGSNNSELSLSGPVVLTGPNMAGKSTLMRTITVCALLANCGFPVPCRQATVPRVSSYFMRMSANDVPTEGRSSFAQEMFEISNILRTLSQRPRSIFMMDELCRGTHPREGRAIVAAILELVDRNRWMGILSTHFWDLWRLPMKLSFSQFVKMSHKLHPITKQPIWTHDFTSGFCTDSLAFVTAEQFGLPKSLTVRASQLLTSPVPAKPPPAETEKTSQPHCFAFEAAEICDF